MKKNRKIIHKTTILGSLLIGVPLVVFLLLLSVVLWRIGDMHRNYSRVVNNLQLDLDTVDQNLLKQNAILNQHQETTRELNRQITEQFLQQQMQFSAMEILLMFHADPQVSYSHSTQRILQAYLSKSNPGFFGLPAPIPAVNPLDSEENAEDVPRTEDTDPAESIKAVPAIESPDKELARQITSWCEKHNFKRDNHLASLMDRFNQISRLGFENRELILIAHMGPHEHEIIWSTEPKYIAQPFSRIMRTMSQLAISENYMRNFLLFQRGERNARLLFHFEYAEDTAYSEARYNLSKQRYFGLIPLLGTNLSLGMRSPLAHEFIQSIDTLGQDLNKISTGLVRSDQEIRSADRALAGLHREFENQNAQFRKIFIFTLILAALFILITSLLALRSVQRGFIKPILHMQDVTRHIQDGYFERRVKVTTDDELQELGKSINAMLDRIVILIRSDEDRQRVSQDIFQLLDVVSRASSGDLTVRGTVSTDELQSIVDAFNHMMNSIGTLVIKVRSAGIQVEHMSGKLLDYSRRILEKSQKQIQDLDIASRKIKALGDRSQEITRMVEQIGTIALETNTLALNASLEAARSGKHDAGIGHLAEHVRQLADGLNKTKQDIESFIGSIQLATNYAVASVEEVLHMSQQTTSEAEMSYHTAEQTSVEASHLGEAISRFKVKTMEDKEREKRIFRELSFVAYSLSEIRRTLRDMDSSEFDNMNSLLSSFHGQLKQLGVEENAFEHPEVETGGTGEVPAILPETENAAILDDTEDPE